MTAVRLRARAELRRRWRGWLGLALLIGLVGGLVTGVAAGARRTDTAYERLQDRSAPADLLVLDTQRVHLVPAVRIVSAWIHNGQPNDIESVMIDGQFVMRDRTITTVDEAAIIAEADKVGKRVWAAVEKAGAITIPRLPRPK